MAIYISNYFIGDNNNNNNNPQIEVIVCRDCNDKIHK
jgi:hypothetical protein